MTPSRPFLIRAIREWIVHNGYTPQFIVDAEHEGVAVPASYVEDGRIVVHGERAHLFREEPGARGRHRRDSDEREVQAGLGGIQREPRAVGVYRLERRRRHERDRHALEDVDLEAAGDAPPDPRGLHERMPLHRGAPRTDVAPDRAFRRTQVVRRC